MQKFNLFFILVAAFLNASSLSAQNAQQANFTFKSLGSVNLSAIEEDWKVYIQYLGDPEAQNYYYNKFLRPVKQETAKRFPRKENYTPIISPFSAAIDTPTVLRSFAGKIWGGSVPCDNTLAISNGGMLLSAVNQNLMVYDTNSDTLLLDVSLSAFWASLNLPDNKYDPKLLYDQEEDKFIFICLNGFADSTSKILVAFSQSNDPTQNWNLYALEGNPLNNGTWTDFPSMAVSDDELFITGNLIQPGVSWQLGFKQTIIWQVDKSSGFLGNTLNTKLWSEIKYGSTYIRNMNPIKGGSSTYGNKMYLLSNRNFDVENDSIFILTIDGKINESPALTIDVSKANNKYGAPPEALMSNGQYLATNDARLLEGFYENNKIQFAGNTVNPANGKACVSHGIITNLTTTKDVALQLITHSEFEFGYPNLSYSGITSNEDNALISFNYVSKNHKPGFVSMNYDGSTYSDPGIVKSGLTDVSLLQDTIERWGDYFGSQRKYNEPGKVWIAGYFGRSVKIGQFQYINAPSTWIAELTRPDGAIGIKEVESVKQGTIFPNPGTDLFHLEFVLAKPANITVLIYDLNGRLVKQLQKGNLRKGKSLLSFDRGMLNAGQYLLSIQEENKILETHSLIIQ